MLSFHFKPAESAGKSVRTCVVFRNSTQIAEVTLARGEHAVTRAPNRHLTTGDRGSIAAFMRLTSRHSHQKA
jgi:hypothetical protein